MGWGRMLLLGNIGQQMDLADHRDELEKLRTGLGMERALREGADEMIGGLRRENDELKLYLAALVRLLIARQVVSAADIRAIVDTLDREDDKVDGRYAGPIVSDQ